MLVNVLCFLVFYTFDVVPRPSLYFSLYYSLLFLSWMWLSFKLSQPKDLEAEMETGEERMTTLIVGDGEIVAGHVTIIAERSYH